jgi:thiol-disulfide isomerase/thioredoxin
MKRLSLIGAFALATLVLQVQPLLAQTRAKAAAPERIAFGQEVNLTDYLVPGKTVVFDFTSEFCPPCRAISPYLDKLHAKRDDVVVVKVDINRPDVRGIDWGSPVAKQYGMQSIPHFKVFGPDGKLQAEGKPARELVTGWFEE